MKKYIQLLALLIFFSLAFVFHSNFTKLSYAQEKPIIYELPFPGILPDHPLYFLKQARDRVWVFFTRDNLKKAEVLLLLADKKTAMAQELAHQKKWQLSIDMMEEANTHVADIITTLQLSRKIGTGVSSDFVDQVRLSADKREEIMESVITQTPLDIEKTVKGAIERNLSNRNALDSL